MTQTVAQANASRISAAAVAMFTVAQYRGAGTTPAALITASHQIADLLFMTEGARLEALQLCLRHGVQS